MTWSELRKPGRRWLATTAVLAVPVLLAGCSASATDSVVDTSTISPSATADVPAGEPESPSASASAGAPTSASAAASKSASASASASASKSAGTAASKKPASSKPTKSKSPAKASAPSATVSPRLSVSKVTGISISGDTVRVSGSGFDTTKGIYVAFCVKPPAGQAPSPCGGGADTDGDSGSSEWISSNPPPYGKSLAKPYGSGGTFTVSIKVSPKIGSVDCRVSTCVIATRADHTRSSDRSQDVFIPISFAGGKS